MVLACGCLVRFSTLLDGGGRLASLRADLLANREKLRSQIGDIFRKIVSKTPHFFTAAAGKPIQKAPLNRFVLNGHTSSSRKKKKNPPPLYFSSEFWTAPVRDFLLIFRQSG